MDMTKLVDTEVRSRKISREDRACVTSCMETYFEVNQHEGFFPEKDLWKFEKRVKEIVPPLRY